MVLGGFRSFHVLVLTFRSVEFFLQVFMTDFNSFKRGKYKEVRSLVSEEASENYSFVSLVSLSRFSFFPLPLTRIDKDC